MMLLLLIPTLVCATPICMPVIDAPIEQATSHCEQQHSSPQWHETMSHAECSDLDLYVPPAFSFTIDSADAEPPLALDNAWSMTQWLALQRHKVAIRVSLRSLSYAVFPPYLITQRLRI